MSVALLESLPKSRLKALLDHFGQIEDPREPYHPSFFPGSPERWWGDEALKAEAQAAQAPGEERHQAACNILAMRPRSLFSAGVRFSTASHIPVDTAQ